MHTVFTSRRKGLVEIVQEKDDINDSCSESEVAFEFRDAIKNTNKKEEIYDNLKGKTDIYKESNKCSLKKPIKRKIDFSKIGTIFSNPNNLKSTFESNSNKSKYLGLRTTSKQSKPSIGNPTTSKRDKNTDSIFNNQEKSNRSKVGTFDRFPLVTPFCVSQKPALSTGQKSKVKHLAELSIFNDDTEKFQLAPIFEAFHSPNNYEETLKLLNMIEKKPKYSNKSPLKSVKDVTSLISLSIKDKVKLSVQKRASIYNLTWNRDLERKTDVMQSTEECGNSNRFRIKSDNVRMHKKWTKTDDNRYVHKTLGRNPSLLK